MEGVPGKIYVRINATTPCAKASSVAGMGLTLYGGPKCLSMPHAKGKGSRNFSNMLLPSIPSSPPMPPPPPEGGMQGMHYHQRVEVEGMTDHRETAGSSQTTV